MKFMILITILLSAMSAQAQQTSKIIYCDDQATSMYKQNKIRNPDYVVRLKNTPTGLLAELVIGGPTKGKTFLYQMTSSVPAPKIVAYTSQPAGMDLKIDFRKPAIPRQWLKCYDDCEEPGEWSTAKYTGYLSLRGGKAILMYCSVGL